MHGTQGFQTTYEELKPGMEIGLNFYFRFQTTYEELKLETKQKPNPKGSASRLPMRN